MVDLISFKVILVKVNDPNETPIEIRRFGIEKALSTNYLYLYEKLQSVFVGLRDRWFLINWKDAEGDKVCISSEEELKLALSETNNQKIRKLYVVISHPYHDSPPVNLNSPGPIHTGVVCDECDRDIRGFRYMCIKCPDYDLCSDCEAKGRHAEHCMIRTSFPLQMGQRLTDHIKKFDINNSHCPDKDKNACGCPNRNGRYPRASGEFTKRSSWIDKLIKYLDDRAYLSPGETSPMQGRAAEETGSNKMTQRLAQEKLSVHYPDDVNATVESKFLNFLDSLVNDSQTSSQYSNASTKPAENNFATSSQSNSSAASVETIPGQERKLGDSTPAIVIPPSAATVESNAFTEKPSNEENKAMPIFGSKTSVHAPAHVPTGFVFNETKFEQSKQQLPSFGVPPRTFPIFEVPAKVYPQFGVQPTTNITGFVPPKPLFSVPAVQPAILKTHPTYSCPQVTPPTKFSGNIPQAPNNPASQTTLFGSVKPIVCPQLPAKPDTPIRYHEDPNVQRSVVAMIQMGFTNEGGWLTQLLESQNGDIDKALDILQPGKSALRKK